MSPVLCRRCGEDLTERYVKRHTEAMKHLLPKVEAFKADMKERGILRVKAKIGQSGGTITCTECGYLNRVRLETVEELEKLILEVNV